ncbi:neutral/alkaline non-lysosomal ceramidase N-terminal domain-containing protein [Daejeonella lutea]|uniref:Neutral/alkaline non-lysosomal ceramidase, N-terminal n=1 Tax=Daejeonella lutea TaxID=572036 RepID=A0A1T5A8F1_9SPHI|nr:neutral/alkaline non-lysosomal ceramidase N-terminal domain-containing protein [Daejeonella lutea]SKB30997.1 Neutral/alkaline non-lysosomal ceramidase, N-terminal [Daejeonella lutea]
MKPLFIGKLVLRKMQIGLIKKFFALVCILLSLDQAFAQKINSSHQMIDAGVSTIDITPAWPVRLAGFAIRSKSEAEGTSLPLHAKALALGNDSQGASVIITVDLIGIPWKVTKEVARRLSVKTGLKPAQLAISASHTHSGPELGDLLNILQYRSATAFSDSLISKDQMNHISLYVEQLTDKLEQVAIESLNNRKSSYVAWTQGKVDFAKNRRLADGPVDHSLPLLRVTDTAGKLKALFLNYSCHAVTLDGSNNKYHGDWVGEAQRLIELNHPGVTALHAVGCGADANPTLTGLEGKTPLQRIDHYALKIADEVNRLLSTNFQPLNKTPEGKVKIIELPYEHVPTIKEMVAQTEDKTVKGYYYRLALNEIARGKVISPSLTYPIQVWTFGKELAMVFLAGEVVSDYSLRIKREFDIKRVWVNAYSNDVPCYIASTRALKEPRYSYEAVSSMYYYHKPSPFAQGVEEIIMSAVHDLIPSKFLTTK